MLETERFTGDDVQGTWLREPTAGRVIIFVHGLWSSNATAWSSANTSWPDLVLLDPQLAGYGVYKFDYKTSPASRFFGAGDAAKSLTAHIEMDRLYDRDQLLFVCHSQGGIVVRHHLVRSRREYETRQVSVGLLLVASPSLGSAYASIGSLVWFHAQLQGLRFSQKNKWLNELDADFVDLKEERRFPLFGKELVEERPMVLPRGLLPRTQIVPPYSAAKYFAKSRIIAGTDHSSIAKPTSLASEQYRELVHLAQTVAIAADADFAVAQRAAQAQLERIFVDAAAARMIAGPSPAFLAAAPPVPRVSLRAAGEAWWGEEQQVLVQLGHEGMGKTWGALDLLRLLSATPGGPLPIIISAQRAGASVDGLGAVMSALTDIAEQARLPSSDTPGFWRQRLALWASNAPGPCRRLLILVDGLDELDPFDWAAWLAPLLVEHWQGLIRIVLTCRDDDWDYRIRLDAVLPANSARSSVTRFLPEERDAYLTSRGIVATDVSDQVLEAALHPRTAFHLARLADELGDLTRITREQLLLRDFHNRHLLKGGAFGADGFKALVIAQATAAQAAALIQQAYRVTPGALIDAAADISGYDRSRMRNVLSDLISGAWLERDSATPHLLSFSDAALPDAVGFALADLIRPLTVGAALQEIDRFLEPWGADDLVEKVLRTCATALIVDPAVADDLCAAVLKRWEDKPTHGGGSQDFWRRLHIFRPALFLDYCARHARGSSNWLLAWGIASLWEDHLAERPAVEERVGAWLSTVPLPEDHDSGDASYDRHVNRDRQRQRERLVARERVEPGKWAPRIGQSVADWPLTAVRTAAQIISFLPRRSFVPAIAAWAENHAAAGHVAHEREVATLLRHNDIDHDSTLIAVRDEAARLSSCGGDGVIAAASLLRATGEPDDAAQAEELDPQREVVRRSWIERMAGTNVIGLVADRPLARANMVIDVLACFAADPSITLDPTLAAALSAAVAVLTPADLPPLFDQGGARLAVVLRWHSDTVFALYRRFLQETAPAQGDDDDAIRNPVTVIEADKIFRRHALGALPFLSIEECATVANAIEARAATVGAGLGAANALRLAHRPLAEQIPLLRATPSSAWPRDYRHLLNEPAGSEITDLIADLDLSAPSDALAPLLTMARELVLRFGASCARDWRAGLDHPDEGIRRCVTQLSTYVDGADAAAQLLTLTGPGSITGSGLLSFETSALLLKASDAALLPLLCQLHLETLAQAYLHRPQLRAEIAPLMWASIEQKLLVRQTSRSFGGSYSYFVERDAAFASFCADKHDEVVHLLHTAWQDKALRDNIRWEHGEGPAWGLIKALASSEPQLVKTIWRGCIDDFGGMWIGSTEAFPCDLPVGETFDDLRAEMLDRANTDDKLFTAVRELEMHGHRTFLLGWIAARLDGDRALTKARALTAAGLLDATEGALALWRDIDATQAPAGWLGDVRSAAKAWIERVKAARHWYLVMGKAANEEEAYRAFWLFSHNSDDRYPLYFRIDPFRVSPTSWRAQWLDFVGEAMKADRAEAAKGLKDSYAFGKRVNDIVNGL